MSKKSRIFRELIAREAARLMYEEGVDQFLDAKQKAARRITGKAGGVLPSNGQISDELYQLAMFRQGDKHQQKLFEMRLLALDVMEHLADFSPRLIGSVSTGRIRDGSDVDLHVFVDHIEVLFNHLSMLEWPYECREVWINAGGKPNCYNHVYLSFEYPVELSVYDTREIRVRGRSSTDGKPIDRMSASRVRDLLMTEHEDAWQEHLAGALD